MATERDKSSASVVDSSGTIHILMFAGVNEQTPQMAVSTVDRPYQADRSVSVLSVLAAPLLPVAQRSCSRGPETNSWKVGGRFHAPEEP